MSVCALVSTYSVLSQLLLIRYGKFRYPNRSIVRLINLLQVVDQTFHVRTGVQTQNCLCISLLLPLS